MWVIPATWMLLLAASGGTAAPAAPAMPELVYTRQPLFAIPFRIERGDTKAAEPTAVQLQVSADRGQSWQVYSKVPANLGRFQFRAARDGEYWFVVQTVDADGQLRPAQPGVPGLRIAVDTTPPRLELEAGRGPHGEISVRWRITESNLDPRSVRLLYRTDASANLESVALDRRQLEVPRTVRAGDVSWWLPAGANRAEIRAEARDAAGNVAVGHAQVDRQAPATAPAAPAPADAAARPTPLPKPDEAPQDQQDQWSGAGEPPLPWQRPLPPKPLAKSLARPLAQLPPKATAPAPSPAADDAGPLLGPQFGVPSHMPQPVQPLSQSAPEASVAIQINPALGRQFSSSGTGEAASDSSSVQPRMVNSRAFELDYAVDQVGPSGIDRVELWGTRDGQRTWKTYGVDEDKHSPFLVRVEEEGVYGFRVAIRSGAGLGGDPPQPDDEPDLWIGVDLTKPEARLLAAEQVSGKEVGEIVIRWEAHDRALAPQPVTLLYSATPGGPWQPIAANLDNSGQYTWTVGRGVPGLVYLRLEVQDAAGNLGIFEAPQPVAVDRQRPSGRIRDIRPVGPSARTPSALPRR